MNSNRSTIAFRLLQGCGLFLMLLPSLGWSQDYLDAAVRALKNAARRGDLLSDCLSYQGITPKGGCVPADEAGFGLRCGTTKKVTGGTNETCDRNLFSVLRGMLDANVLARLEGSSLNTAQMYAEIEPRESVQHDHRIASELGDTCAAEYIKRKDFVRFRFAVYNSAKVALRINTVNWGTFESQVEDSEGFTARDQALICGWVRHPEPRYCSPAH